MIYSGYLLSGFLSGMSHRKDEKSESEQNDAPQSILVICQELFKEDFDVFFRKKGNFNRPSVCI